MFIYMPKQQRLIEKVFFARNICRLFQLIFDSKRKHYGFKLSKFLDSKKSVLRMQNKDSLCLARALVTDIARQDKDPEWNSIRMRHKEQRLLAQQLDIYH